MTALISAQSYHVTVTQNTNKTTIKINELGKDAALLAQEAASHAESIQETVAAYSEKAEQWAENPVDEQVEFGKYSCRHYYTKITDLISDASIDAQTVVDTAIEVAENASNVSSNYNSITTIFGSIVTMQNNVDLLATTVSENTNNASAYMQATLGYRDTCVAAASGVAANASIASDAASSASDSANTASSAAFAASTSALEATDSESNAAASESAVTALAAAASTSASEALGYRDTASAAATSASASASNAATSEAKAADWAEEDEDVEVEAGMYSAKHWAVKAATQTHSWGDILGTLSDQTDLQTALDGKASTSHSQAISTVTGLQDALAGKSASTHDHDADYEPKNTNIQTHITNTANPHGVDKSDVGLGNVDNTSDAAKPVSTATATALAGKSNTGHGHAISDTAGLQTALDGKASTSHTQAISTITSLQTALDGKSDTIHNHDGSYLQDITAGTNISIDKTDPDNPTISASGTVETDWGSIGGTLSNQTDLASALDGKSATSHNHSSSNISDFATAVSGNSAVAANTAKRSYPTTDEAKLDSLDITQAVSAAASSVTLDGDVYDSFYLSGFNQSITLDVNLSAGRTVTLFLLNPGSYTLTWDIDTTDQYWPDGAEVTPDAAGITVVTITKVSAAVAIVSAQTGYTAV